MVGMNYVCAIKNNYAIRNTFSMLFFIRNSYDYYYIPEDCINIVQSYIASSSTCSIVSELPSELGITPLTHLGEEPYYNDVPAYQ